MKSTKVPFICFFAILLFLNQKVMAKEVDKTISYYFDNDTIIGTDRCFTGGYRLSWTAFELKNFKEVPWLKWIPINKKSGSKHLLSLSIGQSVYTPDDISQSKLILDDRPYAGYLYFATAFHSVNSKAQESFEISLGIIGRHAFGEETQSFIHQITGSIKPQGWQNQLKDEFVLQLFYEKSLEVKSAEISRNLRFEIIPQWGAGLGNAIISGTIGLFSRLGCNIPKDFGLAIKRPSGLKGVMLGKKVPMGIYGFISIQTFFNVRNIFLDGNTLKESHSVDKYFFTGDVNLGLVMHINRFHIAYTYTIWTKRFKTESRPHRYGSLSIAYIY
jgi:hypothetical protein